MKRLLSRISHSASSLLLASLAACGTLQVQPPAAPASAAASVTTQQAATTASAADVQVRRALEEIVVAKKLATTLAENKTISWQTDAQAQATLTALRAQFLSAQAVFPTNPQQAAVLLQNALNDFANYQKAAPQ